MFQRLSYQLWILGLGLGLVACDGVPSQSQSTQNSQSDLVENISVLEDLSQDTQNGGTYVGNPKVNSLAIISYLDEVLSAGAKVEIDHVSSLSDFSCELFFEDPEHESWVISVRKSWEMRSLSGETVAICDEENPADCDWPSLGAGDSTTSRHASRVRPEILDDQYGQFSDFAFGCLTEFDYLAPDGELYSEAIESSFVRIQYHPHDLPIVGSDEAGFSF